MWPQNRKAYLHLPASLWAEGKSSVDSLCENSTPRLVVEMASFPYGAARLVAGYFWLQ
jgi:hypothetical protein